MSNRRSFALLIFGVVVTVAGALSSSELLEVNSVLKCGRQDSFSTSVIVQHEILEKEWKTAEELSILAANFLNTYNTLNAPREGEPICDRVYNRAAMAVSVTAMPSLYKQYEGQTTYYRDVVYEVKGICTGCAPDTSLFDIGEGKARTGSEITKLASEKNTCSCSPSKDPSTSHAPSEREFKRAFRSVVRKLSGGEELPSTDNVDRVLEVEGKACINDPDSFASGAVIEFSTEPEDDDLKVISDAFVNAYNYLLPIYCDPEHHHLERFDFSDSRRSLRRRLQDRLFDGTFRGRCRGCRSEARLFNDRRLLAEEGTGDMERRVAQTTECYCSIHSEGHRTPTLEEFADLFNKTLIAARADGFLKEDVYCMKITEKSADTDS